MGKTTASGSAGKMGRGVSELLELCFDESTRGSLRVAQHCADGGRGTIGLIFGAGEEPTSEAERAAALDRARRAAEERRREAVSLGGHPDDVLALSLGLSTGDIRDPLGEERWPLRADWYEEEKTADKYWRRNLEAAARLAACGAGDHIRIWVDQTPDSACGLLHAASLLKGTEASVSLMLLPPWRVRSDGTVVTYRGWGEVSPEEFGHFLHLEQPLTPIVLRMLVDRWRVLQEENAPLRAIINGRIHSVGEEFYDDCIRRALPFGQKRIAEVIVEILTRQQPGIGDRLLADRIRVLMDRGEYRMVQENRERFYGSIIEKT